LPGYPNVDILFKNESASKTGSLKHRYSWALMMWAVVDGKITHNTTVYEASSGNTAASEAYMCSLIGVKFIAIVPDTIEDIKVEHIESYGGSVIKVPLGKRLIRAQEEADRNGGFFMNQFANSDKAEEFHESGDFTLESANLLHEILAQMRADANQLVKIPHYFVHAAGTGGTISSVGRYAKKYGISTDIVLGDTEYSVYYDYVMKGRFKNESGELLWRMPGMAGIGYGIMGAVKHGITSSLLAAVIDRAIKVPDLASTAGMLVLKRLGISGGTSAGLNLVTSLHLAATRSSSKRLNGRRLTIVTLLPDPGHYYDTSYYNRSWIQHNFEQHGGLVVYDCWVHQIEMAIQTGSDPLISGANRCNKLHSHSPISISLLAGSGMNKKNANLKQAPNVATLHLLKLGIGRAIRSRAAWSLGSEPPCFKRSPATSAPIPLLHF
uniref:PALP domain-containing protein n=1 Tax=Anisakis simplex TaxID=6269 RepID=A0A158PPA8_ANISI